MFPELTDKGLESNTLIGINLYLVSLFLDILPSFSLTSALVCLDWNVRRKPGEEVDDLFT